LWNGRPIKFRRKELGPCILKGDFFTSACATILPLKYFSTDSLVRGARAGDLKYYIGQSLDMAEVVSVIGSVRGLEYKHGALRILADTPPPLDTIGFS